MHTRFDVTDLFCGAGGSSSGIKQVKDAELRVAANHWQAAVETHETNHPEATHWCADIHPGAHTHPRFFPRTSILIASPECTNHTIAKGQKTKNRAQLSLWEHSKLDPAEERSRVTMFTVPWFAEYHQYEYIIIENVVDIRYWHQWDMWLQDMANLGYDWEICYFNSMFFNPVNGLHDYAPQSRDRIYIVFWKQGNRKPNLDFRPKAPCSTCEREVQAVQSWKNPSKMRWGRYRKQYIYCCPRCANEVVPFFYCAYNAIDWSVPITRIGDRPQPLKPRTMERIQNGLEKYAGKPAVVQLGYASGHHNRISSLVDPFPTQTTAQTVGMLTGFSYDKDGISLDASAPTQTGRQDLGLVTPFIVELHGTSEARQVNREAPCQLSGGNHTAVVSTFHISYYSRANAHASNGEPIGAVSTQNRNGLVVPPLVMAHNNTCGKPLDQSVPVVTGVDRISFTVPKGIDIEDCGFRMFVPHEVKDTMGFNSEYVLLGSNRQQVKLAGNAVTPPVMEYLGGACKEALLLNGPSS